MTPTTTRALVLCSILVVSVWAQNAAPLRDVKTIQVDPTVVPNPDKVKDPSAPNMVQDSLRGALRYADFEIGDAPVRAHIVLDEFSSGSQAKRTLIGFGAGRSTVTCRLVFLNADGKEIANTPIHVRGNTVFSPYEGGKTQQRQAVSTFEQRLIEEIRKLK